MLRKFGFILLMISALGAVYLQLTYGLDYVARVYVKQESSANDFEWKPRLEFEKAQNSKSLPARLHHRKVEQAFASAPVIETLDEILSDAGTTALIVVKDGEIIYESHHNEHVPGGLIGSFSVSKSVLSILLGNAILQGDISALDDSITKYIPELASRNAQWSNISLTHLIDMRSGIAFDSDISFPFYNEDETLIYYGNDLRKTLLTRPHIEEAPGSFLYNDFNPNLISLAMERANGRQFDKRVQDFLEQIGTEYPALWSTDYRGFALAESGFAAAPIDLAKIGQAMLDDNSTLRTSFFSNEWFVRSSSRQNPQTDNQYDGRNWGYRNGWWLIDRPDGPADFSAIGHLGQYIYISPKYNTVIVRTGIHRGSFHDDDFTAIFYNVVEQL